MPTLCSRCREPIREYSLVRTYPDYSKNWAENDMDDYILCNVCYNKLEKFLKGEN